MTKVFVIILNWNGKKDTHECLKSVQKLTNVGFQLSVVVVDNGSKDGSVRSIKKQFKDIAVLENKENLGYVGGSNVGVKHALENGADFVMVLNNDTTIKEDLIIKFLEAADTYKDVAAVKTLAVGAQWVTSDKADLDTVYQITKALYSDAAQKTLAAGHAKGKYINLKNAVQGVGIPFHPGAEKFYKEAGVLK